MEPRQAPEPEEAQQAHLLVAVEHDLRAEAERGDDDVDGVARVQEEALLEGDDERAELEEEEEDGQHADSIGESEVDADQTDFQIAQEASASVAVEEAEEIVIHPAIEAFCRDVRQNDDRAFIRHVQNDNLALHEKESAKHRARLESYARGELQRKPDDFTTWRFKEIMLAPYQEFRVHLFDHYCKDDAELRAMYDEMMAKDNEEEQEVHEGDSQRDQSVPVPVEDSQQDLPVPLTQTHERDHDLFPHAQPSLEVHSSPPLPVLDTQNVIVPTQNMVVPPQPDSSGIEGMGILYHGDSQFSDKPPSQNDAAQVVLKHSPGVNDPREVLPGCERFLDLSSGGPVEGDHFHTYRFNSRLQCIWYPWFQYEQLPSHARYIGHWTRMGNPPTRVPSDLLPIESAEEIEINVPGKYVTYVRRMNSNIGYWDPVVFVERYPNRAFRAIVQIQGYDYQHVIIPSQDIDICNIH